MGRGDELPLIFERAEQPDSLDAALDEFKELVEAARAQSGTPPEPVPGFHAAVKEMISRSDHVIFLSQREKERLERIGANALNSTIIPNPVDHEMFANADPSLFEEEFGIRDFVLCVARQETRKNQLMLLQALRKLNVPVVLIGHAASANYRKLIDRYTTPNVHLIERLPPNSPLLASAFAAARVSVLPSWAEGAPLAALEAAAAGASLVLSNESGESEYFGEWARYADPASIPSLRSAITEAYETRRPTETISAQKAFIAANYNWARHRDSTRDVYRQVFQIDQPKSARPKTTLAALPAETKISIVYDVTTSANHTGRWTGIARVEAALALALKENPHIESIHFVAWNNKAQSFIEVPFDAIRSGKTNTLLSHYDTIQNRPLSLPENSYYILAGSGWMQNSNYAEGAVAFKHRYKLRLAPIIHDVIPIRFPFWFNDGYAPVFAHNLSVLLGNADQIVAISEWTKSDIEHFGTITSDIFMPEVGVFREGDEISFLRLRSKPTTIADTLCDKSFIICVGAIHQRKNHKLLYDVWLRLAAKMGRRCPTLVIVGGVAWNGEELARAFRGDARVKDHVLILENIDDLDLTWLYNNCLFTVYPSLYEGWGLPVSESLRHGKFCIASNASSIPEIAPEFIELLDPLDSNIWAAKIQFYATSSRARDQRELAIREGYRGFTWAESAQTLVELLARSGGNDAPQRPYTLGRVVALSDRIQSARVKRVGWHLTERWGCWAARHTAALEFELPSSPTEPMVIVAEVQALLFPDTTLEARVLVNGTPVARWVLDRGGLQIRTAAVMKVPANHRNALRIEFESGALTPIARVSKSSDTRSVGIGVGRIAIVPAKNVRDAFEYFGRGADHPRRVSLGVEYNFLKDNSIRSCLEGHWVTNSAWGVLNTNMRPCLCLAVQEAPAEDLTVELFLRSVASEDSPLSLIVLANDVQCGSWTFANDQVQRINLFIPAAVRCLADPLMIDLVPSDRNSPKALGIGELEQEFGFGLVSITVWGPSKVPRGLLPLAAGKPFALSAPSRAEATFDLNGPWHGLEKNGLWSFGALARLPLKLPPALGGTLVVWIEVSAFAADGTSTPVRVEANGEPIGVIQAPGGTPRTVAIVVPESALHGGKWLILDMWAAGASSPYKQGTGEDERLLGLRLRSVSIGTAPLLPQDRVAFFGQIRPVHTGIISATPFAQGEWYSPERGGRWARGRRGKLAMVVDPHLSGRGTLYVLARPVGATRETPVVVDILVRGTTIDSWVFRDDKVAFIELRGFAESTANDLESVLEIRPAAPRSPHDLGISKDTRLLGLLLRAIVVTAPDQPDEYAQSLFKAAGVEYETVLDRTPQSQFDAVSSIMPLSEWLPNATIVITAPELRMGAPGFYDLADLAVTFELLAAGWFEPEPEGTWSEASGAELRLPGALPPSGRVEVGLLARVFGTTLAGPATVALSVLGKTIAHIRLVDDNYHWIELMIDVAAFGGYAPALGFRRLAPVTPAQLGSGDDARPLGVFVKGLTVGTVGPVSGAEGWSTQPPNQPHRQIEAAET